MARNTQKLQMTYLENITIIHIGVSGVLALFNSPFNFQMQLTI
jgi:hypothetical protein